VILNLPFASQVDYTVVSSRANDIEGLGLPGVVVTVEIGFNARRREWQGTTRYSVLREFLASKSRT
jgi:hypothetical protein